MVYFIQKKATVLSLKHNNKLTQMVENTVKIIQCLIFFSDVLCLLFFFLLMQISKTGLLRELIKQPSKETVNLHLRHVKH